MNKGKLKKIVVIFIIVFILVLFYLLVSSVEINNTLNNGINREKNIIEKEEENIKDKEIFGAIGEIFPDERRILLYSYNKEIGGFSDEIEVFIADNAEILIPEKKNMAESAKDVNEYNERIEGLSDNELKQIKKPSIYSDKKEKIDFGDLEIGLIAKTLLKRIDEKNILEKIEILSQDELREKYSDMFN